MVEIYVGILGPMITLLFGILVLCFPKILNYLVAWYLIVIGLLGIVAFL